MEEISLRDIILIILKGKWIIALAVILSLLIAGTGSLYLGKSSQSAKVYVSLSFDGIEKGLNPDGTKFDRNTIMAPAVIQDALDTLQIGSDVIDVDSLRRSMKVEAVVPNDIVKRIETMRKDGQEYTYYPNEFVVSLKMPREIDSSLGGRILDAVLDSYSEYFYDIYSRRTVLANAIGSLDYVSFDYPEISTIIHNQIDIMNSFLDAKAEESNGFRSGQTGLTFADIRESVDIIDRVELNRMDSIIGAYNLTRDKDKLIKSYEYRIKMNELEKLKKVDEATQAKNMMDNYKREQNSILIPGLLSGEAGELTGGQGGASYYDTLAERATNAGVEASNNIHDNEYLLKEIEKLKSDTVSAVEKEVAVKQVMAVLDRVKAGLENWIEQTNRTAAEYYEWKLNKAVMRLSPVQVQSGVNMKMNLAIALVIGLMLGVFIAFFREYWRSGAPAEGREKDMQKVVGLSHT